MSAATAPPRTGGGTLVLPVLAASQFLMTLDSSVMNVSLAQVADDLGTPITGIQTAITLYTLVMATLMVTGGKVGSVLGMRRALGIGLVVYGAGSLTTALAPSLPVLLLGWSGLEGIGAALIMPALVGLVAANFPPERRTAAYGLLAAAGAMAVAVGPLIGGAVTTFASWRWVFAAEVVLVLVILVLLRRIREAPARRVAIDVLGSLLSVVGFGLVVFAMLRSSEWGWVAPRPDGPQLLGVSPVVWLLAAGLLGVYAFFARQRGLLAAGREPLVDPRLLGNRRLTGGLGMFFAQFLVQAGVFFVLPLFLAVVLELSAMQTGLRVLPLSVALLLTAAGIPRLWPRAGPRRVVRLGVLAVAAGILVLVGAMEPGASAGIVVVPLLLVGTGLGALASQLGAVTVSAVPDSRSAEVGGLQNTVTNLGASVGTALVGSVLIAALSASVVTGLRQNPEVPTEISEAATTQLAAGMPFVSDTDLTAALERAGLEEEARTAILEVNDRGRYDALRSALALTGLLALLSLFLTTGLPASSPGPPGGGDEPGGGEGGEGGEV